MSNEPNKPMELTEKELAGIAGGTATTEEMKKGVTLTYLPAKGEHLMTVS